MAPTGSEASALDAGLSALRLDLDAGARAKLLDYVRLLERWNRVYNLTAVRDTAEMVPRHLLDSLAVLPHLHGERLLDVGSGAGLPGLILAIARPDLEVTLLDASAKRTRFCRQAVAELGLEGVQVVRSRAQDYEGSPPFPCLVSRAVADLPTLVAAARHLLAPLGVLLAMKGRRPDAEIAALPTGVDARVRRLEVPGLEAARHLVELRFQL